MVRILSCACMVIALFGLTALVGCSTAFYVSGHDPADPIQVSISTTQTSVVAGGTLSFSVTMTGQGVTTASLYVNGIKGGNATYGTISANGVYFAPNTVPANPSVILMAVSDADTSKSASITITITAPTIMSVGVTCSPTSILTNQTATCTSTVTGTGSYSHGVIWSVSPSNLGSVSSAGVFTPAAAGSATITATSAQDGTKAGSAMVSVAVPITVTSIVVTALPTTINASQTATCTAAVSGTGTYNSGVMWTATNGTITSTGVLTPSGVGTTTCTATSVQDPTQSGSASIVVTEVPTVNTVSVSCAARAVPVSQTGQCTAAVAGTGNPSTAVTWSVNNIAGGNSMVGTIDANGVYSAPSAVPTPYTVSISATSVADSTKSGTSPLIVAGTMDTASQFITAANGGTITLLDGSSVTIDPGLLPSDVNVTVSEVSYLSDQPPNPGIGLVGPGLIISFDTPVQFLALQGSGGRMLVDGQPIAHSILGLPSIHAVINAGKNFVSDLNGSSLVANLKGTGTDLANAFVGVTGAIDSTAKTITGAVGQGVLNAITTTTNSIKSVVISAGNIALYNVHRYTTGAGLAMISGSWGNYTSGMACPSGTRLVLVHGMLSSTSGAFPASTAESIMSAGGYKDVLGFDYEWTQAIDSSGAELAAFLNRVVSDCPSVDIDIEAHSEGVPVSMSALNTLNQTNPTARQRIKHLVTLGGPIMGTALADDGNNLAAFLMAYDELDLGENLILDGLDALLSRPFVGDLSTSVAGDGHKLDAIRQALAPGSISNAPQIITVAGNHPHGVLTAVGLLLKASNVQNSDGVIPVASALGFQNQIGGPPALKVYPLFPFAALDHSDLEGNSGVITSVGAQVKNLLLPPSLTLSASPSCTDDLVCIGPPGTKFIPGGNGFSVNNTNAGFEEFSTGEVDALSGFTSSNGTVPSTNWPDSVTSCSTAPLTVEYFAQDLLTPNSGHSSNAVIREINSSSCVTSTAGPTAQFTMSAPGMATVNAPNTLTVSVASGGSVNVTFTSISVAGSAAIKTYQWQSNGSAIPGCGNAQSCSHTFSVSSNTIQLVVTDNNGNTSTATGYVDVSTQQTGQQAPTAITGSASLVMTTSATLGGTINPNGSDTHFYFVYGTSSTLSGTTMTTPSQDLGSGTSASNISANIAGLTPGTQYYFRLIASNNNGTANGSIVGFSTTATQGAPTLQSLSTSPTTPAVAQQFSITLNGTNFVPSTAQIVLTGTACPCTVPNNVLTTKTSSQIVGPITLNNPGNFTVAVQNGPGGATSNALPITAAYITPTITGITPSSFTQITQGSDKVPATIAGTGITSQSYQQYSVSNGAQWLDAQDNPISITPPGSMTIYVATSTVEQQLWRVCAYKGSGTSPSNPLCSNSLAVNIHSPLAFTNLTPPSITTATVGYQATMTATGSNFKNVNKVYWTWSGTVPGNRTWLSTDTDWSSKLIVNFDTSMTLKPVVSSSTDKPGTYNWTVTLTDSSGATAMKTFKVTFQ